MSPSRESRPTKAGRKPRPKRPRRPLKKPKPLPIDRRKRPGKRPARTDLRQQKAVARLKQWLSGHPNVASALRWESALGVRDYAAWTDAQRRALYRSYWLLHERQPLNLMDP